MMNKVITYTTDTDAFMAELESIAPTYVTTDEETGKKSSTIFTTPVIKNENGSLALSMLSNDELAFLGGMTTIESLGTYEQMFANEDKLAKYKSVYPYDIPVVYTDDEGNEQSYMLPEKIGVFA